MIGAIIADIAASTYEKDKNLFFSQLVSDDMKLSLLGDCLQSIGCLLIKKPQISKQEFENMLCNSEIKNSDTMLLMRAIAIAWIYDTIDEVEEKGKIICSYNNKTDYYAWHFLAKLIFALRTGSPKKRAAQVEHVGTFRSFTKHEYWRADTGILGTLIRAWMAFYDAFDYGSALHNAMKLSGDRHLNAILVGALADAMYGCERYLIKKKYGESKDMDITKYVDNDIVKHCNSMRTFFPKNNARTNVEIHLWKDILTPFENKGISDELRRRILKAFYPSWEHRYGFYLDDGWVYIYRSGHLPTRFRLNKSERGWIMQNIQSSGDTSIVVTALEEALYAVNHYWFWVSDEKTPKNMEYCKYYHGEPEMPKEWEETTEGHFWWGERMFIHTKQDMEGWKATSASVLKKLRGKKRELFLSYSEEQRAIILYIETLFEKWCPMSDIDWIYKY